MRAADRTVGAVQGRVAVSRLERDLRLASAGGCPFAAAGPVLEASASQVVFLRRAATGSKPILVEWEVVGGSLMRRWGPCPDETPSTYPHSNFSDNKTMLENLGNGSSLEYVVNGMLVSPPVAGTDLAAIDAVVLTLQIGRGPAHVNDSMVTTGRVGR
ncbi:MAG: hypothetical protein A2133_11950 [Actinobacteria bacterium RBG_16_64_13]|nr:MAG: hypothetical protein A2133_11950 [Actinobacteria bacterium RBG_16_64_13]